MAALDLSTLDPSKPPKPAIFQRVTDDPDSSDKASQVAFKELWWVDYPKLYQQNTLYSVAKFQ